MIAQTRGEFVRPGKTSAKLSPLQVVVLPLVFLFALFGAIVLGVSLNERITFVSPTAFLIACISIYAAVVFALGQSGVSKVREIDQTSHFDALTKLPNRRALHHRIDRMRAAAKRSRSRLSTSIASSRSTITSATCSATSSSSSAQRFSPGCAAKKPAAIASGVTSSRSSRSAPFPERSSKASAAAS